jgi:hypothetical protein
MFDDPEQIRAQARHAARMAAEARRAATSVSSNSSVQWHSRGADRFRHQLSNRAAEFRRRADDLDELSRLLYSHARQVEDHERALRKGADFVGDVVKAASPLGLVS